MKIAIVGAAGRMGKMLVALADAHAALEVVAKVDVAEGYDKTWPAGTEAVIDFSFHSAVPAFVAKAAEEGLAYVLGTTGLRRKNSRPSMRRRSAYPSCRAATIRWASICC